MSESPFSDRPAIGFIGAGKTALALAVALHRAGYRLTTVASRTEASARHLAQRVPGCHVAATFQEVSDRCDVVFITTPDSAIAQVAEAVAWRPGQGVVHCSGATSLECLAAAGRRGARVASFHPLLTFAVPEAALKYLPGSIVALEGDSSLLSALEEMATRLGCQAIRLDPAERPLYHAAAVMSCGYVATLLEQAVGLWQRLGFSKEIAAGALTNLTRATLDNIVAVGLAQAVTGPVVRGDIDTVRHHLEALLKQAPQVVPLYCRLGRASLAGVHQSAPGRLQELENLFREYEGRLQPEEEPFLV